MVLVIQGAKPPPLSDTKMLKLAIPDPPTLSVPDQLTAIEAVLEAGNGLTELVGAATSTVQV